MPQDFIKKIQKSLNEIEHEKERVQKQLQKEKEYMYDIYMFNYFLSERKGEGYWFLRRPV